MSELEQWLTTRINTFKYWPIWKKVLLAIPFILILALFLIYTIFSFLKNHNNKSLADNTHEDIINNITATERIAIDEITKRIKSKEKEFVKQVAGRKADETKREKIAANIKEANNFNEIDAAIERIQR